MNIKRLSKLNYLLNKLGSEESNLSRFIESLSEENKEYFRSLSDKDKGLFEMLTPSELEQLGSQIEGSQFKYVPALKWLEFRGFLQERSLKSNPKLDLELTAYTPGETLSLLQNPKIVDWMQKIKDFKIPEQYKLIVLVPCAKTKPWGMTRPKKSDYYNAFNKLKEMAEKGEFSKSLLNTIYFVTISEPLGIVPQDHWDDFPQYDNPGLFKDPVMRSGLLTKDYTKSPIETKHIIPFDKDAYDSAIGILGGTIRAFLENNKAPGRLFVSFVEDSSGKIKTTHSDMLDRARIQDILPEENRFRKPSGQTSRKEDKKTPMQHYLEHLEGFSEKQATSADRLLIKANVYYYLSKKAEIFEGMSGTSEEYGGYFTQENESEEDLPRENVFGGQPLPPFKDFKKFFEKTNLKYRSVYMDYLFNLPGRTIIDFDTFKSNIKKYMDDYKSGDLFKKIKSTNKTKLSEIEKRYKEGKVILDNFDKIFKKDAVNIIANKFDVSDDVDPMALSHDLGHGLKIDEECSAMMKSDSVARSISQDYQMIIKNKEGDIKNIEISETIAKEIFNEIIFLIISKNNEIPDSISNKNLQKTLDDFVMDFIPDLMVYYHLGGDSLNQIKLSGIKIESESDLAYFKNISSINKEIPPGYELICICPISQDIPNIKNNINSILQNLNSIINEKLDQLIGKIIILWEDQTQPLDV